MMVSQERYEALYAHCEPYVRHGRDGLPAVWVRMLLLFDGSDSQTAGRGVSVECSSKNALSPLGMWVATGVWSEFEVGRESERVVFDRFVASQLEMLLVRGYFAALLHSV